MVRPDRRLTVDNKPLPMPSFEKTGVLVHAIEGLQEMHELDMEIGDGGSLNNDGHQDSQAIDIM